MGMLVHDRIYGETRIHEAVLLELMNSAAMQRLEGVLQHGITGLLDITRDTSRFEHSLGVMLLVRRLGGSLQEQIAALLHDVSHTAFSHVIDYVFDGHDSQSYHEEMKEPFLAASDIPAILARFGYDWRDFLHEEAYQLLEQPSPALCADRLDYFLRDSYDLGLASLEQIRSAVSHLVVHGGRIMVDDLDTARWLAYTFIQADDSSWSDFREVGLYELTAQAIRRAMNLGTLEDDDLWTTDAQAWAKLQKAEDAELRTLLRAISPETTFVWDESDPHFCVSTKIRTIDPDVLVEGEVQRLSELDPDYRFFRLAYLERKTGKWPVRVIPVRHQG